MEEQIFSLPKTIMDYILEHPRAITAHQKVTSTCKYVSFRNKIKIVHCLSSPWEHADWETCEHGREENHRSLKIKEENREQWWIQQKLSIFDPPNSRFLAGLIPRIYKCEAKIIKIMEQQLEWEEFKKLTSNVSSYMSYETIVKDENGKVATLEIILKQLVKISDLMILGTRGLVSENTVSEMEKMEHLKETKTIYITQADEKLDIEGLNEYLKKKNKTTTISISFIESSLQYEKKIDEASNKSPKDEKGQKRLDIWKIW